MTHPDLVMALARGRIDDFRRSAVSGAPGRKSRRRARKLALVLAHHAGSDSSGTPHGTFDPPYRGSTESSPSTAS
jgi:hypothetical protein